LIRLGIRLRSAALVAGLAMAASAGWGQTPEGWTSRDLNGAAPTGSAEFDESGVWTVKGGGKGAAGAADQLQFVFRELQGDGSFVTRVGSLPAEPARAGIMLRESDAPGARSLFLTVTPDSARAYFRPGADAPLQDLGADPLPSGLPLYLRLQRAGNEVQSFVSTDGRLWRAVAGPRVVQLPERVQVGLAVASGEDGTLATATFQDVALEAGLVSPTAIVACGGDSSALLTWRPVPRATGYLVFRGVPGPTVGEMTRLTDRPLASASYTDVAAGLTNGAPVLYTVAPVLRQTDGTLIEGHATAAATTPTNAPGLRACSIGEPIAAPGRLLFDAAAGVVTLSATGSTLGGRADRLFFASQSFNGDFEVTVKLLGLPTATGAQKRRTRHAVSLNPPEGGGENEPAASFPVGLMMREGTEPGARFFMATVSPAEGAGLLWRGVADEPAEGPGEPLIDRDQVPVPLWLRLTRTGNTLAAATSKDGQEFQPLGDPYEFLDNLPGTVEVGVALVGGGPDRPGTARVTDFTIELR
jgi:regulation of enolase protein 1 (concanavalin A-like superfamily)